MDKNLVRSVPGMEQGQAWVLVRPTSGSCARLVKHEVVVSD